MVFILTSGVPTPGGILSKLEWSFCVRRSRLSSGFFPTSKRTIIRLSPVSEVE